MVASKGSGASAGSFAIAAATEAASAPALQTMCLSEDLVVVKSGEPAMQKDLMAMKVSELKEELEERGEAKYDKAWLRWRLRCGNCAQAS